MQWLNNIEESRIKSKYIVSAILALVYMIYAYIFPVPNIHVMEGGGMLVVNMGWGIWEGEMEKHLFYVVNPPNHT